jgi:zinc transport system ATP-binding protein
LGLKPFYTKREKELANENLQKMGITKLKNRCYRELSGGQQQRVLLARALCATKKVILLDEPAAGLDPVVTQNLYELIRQINEDMGITIIMVSHDIHAAVQYAKHILHLCHSQLFFGTTEDYRNSEVGSRFIGGVSHA